MYPQPHSAHRSIVRLCTTHDEDRGLGDRYGVISKCSDPDGGYEQPQITRNSQMNDPGRLVACLSSRWPLPFQRVHCSVCCQVRDQKFPSRQRRRRNIKGIENVRQHRPVHAHRGWLSSLQGRRPNLAGQGSDPGGILLTFLFAQQAVRLNP